MPEFSKGDYSNTDYMRNSSGFGETDGIQNTMNSVLLSTEKKNASKNSKQPAQFEAGDQTRGGVPLDKKPSSRSRYSHTARKIGFFIAPFHILFKPALENV